MHSVFYEKCKISVKGILVFLLLIPLMPLEGLYYINRSAYVATYVLLSIIVSFSVVAYSFVFFLKKKRRIEKTTLVLMLFVLYNVLLTIIKNGDLRGVASVWLYTVPIILLLEINKDRLSFFLKIILIFLETLILLNLLFIMIFPGGLYNNGVDGRMWILGYKSSLQCYVFPAVIISFIFSEQENNYKHFIFILGVSHLVCVCESNAMLLVGLILIDLIFLFGFYKKVRLSKIMIIASIIFIIVANLIVVVYTSSFLSNHYIHYFIVSVLGKRPDLSMRTSNWEAVLPVIAKNPIFGYGYTSDSVRAHMYGRTTAHAHNLILECLYENGMIGLSMFAILNFYVIKTINKNMKYGISIILYFALLVFYIMYIFENLFQKSCGFMWLTILLGAYIPYFNKSNASIRSLAPKKRKCFRIKIIN